MANVKIYSTQTCPWCVRAKNYLRSKNIQFVDVDVSMDSAAAEEMMKKSGQQGAPVIDIGGQIIVGFDQAKIDKLLNIS